MALLTDAGKIHVIKVSHDQVQALQKYVCVCALCNS